MHLLFEAPGLVRTNATPRVQVGCDPAAGFPAQAQYGDLVVGRRQESAGPSQLSDKLY
ncbi:MAG TPA: hypothetical protein VFY93_01775 [Planctomycetota bacterium]|nr:hypothetical protein [Planctomycetota bacterium]